jgi:hypothetical protein
MWLPSSQPRCGELGERDAAEVGHGHQQDGAPDSSGTDQRTVHLPEGDPTRRHSAEWPALANPFGESQKGRKGGDTDRSRWGESARDGEDGRMENDEPGITEQRELVSPCEPD